MGQKYSVTVTLDSGENPDGSPRPVLAGASLSGVVSVEVHQKIKPSIIDIKLIGMEQTVVSRAGRPLRQDHVTLEGRFSLPTCQSGNYQRRGTYNFPFSFELPKTLHSSFQYPSQGKSFNAKIEYTLSITMGKHSLSKVVPIVAAPLPNEPKPSMIKPATHKLKSCGLIDKGVVSVGASLSNSLVGRGQSLILSIASKNNTSANIERVRVKLMEIIEYRAFNDQHSDSCRQQVQEITLQKYKDVSLPNIDKRRKSWREAKRSARSFDEDAAHQAIKDDLSSEENRLLLQVPATARDSVGGTLVTISHYVEVAFVTTGSKNPTVKIPVFIGTPPLAPVTSSAAAASSSSLPIHEASAPLEEDYSIHLDDPGLHVLEYDDIPIVEAVALGTDDISDSSGDGTPQPSAPSESFDFRHQSVYLNNEIAIESNRSSDSLSLGQHALPSMNRFCYELDGPSNETEIVAAMMSNPDWVDFFAELTPTEVGKIVRHVHVDHKVIIASLLFAAGGYTPAHCTAAVQEVPAHMRASMAQNLSPFCSEATQSTNGRGIPVVLH